MGLASAPPHAAICDRRLCLPCRALHCVRPLFLATLASPRTQLGAGLGEYDHLDARVSSLMCVVAPELGDPVEKRRASFAHTHDSHRHSKVAVDTSLLRSLTGGSGEQLVVGWI